MGGDEKKPHTKTGERERSSCCCARKLFST